MSQENDRSILDHPIDNCSGDRDFEQDIQNERPSEGLRLRMSVVQPKNLKIETVGIVSDGLS